MPFEVIIAPETAAAPPGDRRYAVAYVNHPRHKNHITTPRYLSVRAAIATAKRWMEFRHEDPVVRHIDGRILVLPR